jgi:dihydroorotate dehydrogenase (NAD+) catalytic subunit
MNFAVKIKKLIFKNPLLLASGTYGYATQFRDLIDEMGGVITKGITLQPRTGNPPPRIYETTGGMLNSIGLENIGIKGFKKEILPQLQDLKTNLIVNIAGFRIEEYEKLARLLDEEPEVRALELNISCPNVGRGSLEFGQDPKTAGRVVRKVRRATKKIVIPKLTANFTNPVEIAQVCEDEGADALSLVNTLYGLAIDLERRAPFLGGFSGGLSGPAIKPFAIYCVYKVAHKVKIPVIGGGGIVTASDAIEFLLAGARLVSIGSANLVNPYCGLEILSGIESYCEEHNIADIKQLIGSLKSKGK